MKFPNLQLNRTARREELLAYAILGKRLFGDNKTTIGDNLINNCPDIYTNNKQIGAEVVTCESYVDYPKFERFFLGSVFTKRLKFTSKSSNNKNSKKHNFSEYKPIAYKSQDKEYYISLSKNIRSKLKKLNNGNYSMCDKMHLIVMSVYATKPEIRDSVIAKICLTANEKFDKKYDTINVITEDAIIIVDKNNNIEIIETDSKKYLYDDSLNNYGDSYSL